jgi:hypothetical protein
MQKTATSKTLCVLTELWRGFSPSRSALKKAHCRGLVCAGTDGIARMLTTLNAVRILGLRPVAKTATSKTLCVLTEPWRGFSPSRSAHKKAHCRGLVCAGGDGVLRIQTQKYTRSSVFSLKPNILLKIFSSQIQ